MKKKKPVLVMACLPVKLSGFTPSRRLLSTCSTPCCSYWRIHHNLWHSLFFCQLGQGLAWRRDSTLKKTRERGVEPSNARKCQCYKRNIKGVLFWRGPVLSVSFVEERILMLRDKTAWAVTVRRGGCNWRDTLPKDMLTGTRNPPTASWVIKEKI